MWLRMGICGAILKNTFGFALGQNILVKLTVLLTVFYGISVSWNQRDTLFIQFIKNLGPLHVSGITCSSSGGAIQSKLGILRVRYVS
jgi:hypothetical protein